MLSSLETNLKELTALCHQLSLPPEQVEIKALLVVGSLPSSLAALSDSNSPSPYGNFVLSP